MHIHSNLQEDRIQKHPTMLQIVMIYCSIFLGGLLYIYIVYVCIAQLSFWDAHPSAIDKPC